MGDGFYLPKDIPAVYFEKDVEEYIRDVKNYSPDQPRVGKGSPDGGQWTDDGSSMTEDQARDAIQGYKISKVEEDAVSAYTGWAYGDMNDSLRNNGELQEDEKRNIGNLDHFLDKAPKFNGTSYRMMHFANDEDYVSFVNQVEKGAIFKDKAYLSTSTNPDFLVKEMMQDTRVVRIAIEGKRGVYLNGLSQSPEEKEVLFGRNTQFKVIEKKEDQVEYKLRGKPLLKKQLFIKLKQL